MDILVYLNKKIKKTLDEWEYVDYYKNRNKQLQTYSAQKERKQLGIKHAKRTESRSNEQQIACSIAGERGFLLPGQADK